MQHSQYIYDYLLQDKGNHHVNWDFRILWQDLSLILPVAMEPSGRLKNFVSHQMNSTPGHPTPANLKILQHGEEFWISYSISSATYLNHTSAAEVATRAAEEVGQAFNEALDERRAVNGIPKGKAGGGKGEQNIEFF